MIEDATSNLCDVLTQDGSTVTVLLVDDEKAIRSLVAPFLRSQGFTVLEAADGLEAVTLAERHEGPIHLLLTDWYMPRLNGEGVILRLSKARPKMAILVMSGTVDFAFSSGPILRKPFKLQELINRVKDVLE